MISSHSQDKIDPNMEPNQIGAKKTTYRYDSKSKLITLYDLLSQ